MPVFYGEKGAAKSTTCNFLKRLVDPSTLENLVLTNDQRTLPVNLQQHWFLPFDNVSKISEETSDTLCRAITGSGIQQRRLCTNADDYIFTFQRCLAINGISNVANRADLLDRSLLVELQRIPEEDRRELSVIREAFENDLPSILGGVFDTLSKAMAIFPSVKLDKLPRMADFARWGYAVGEALGGYGQVFLEEYTTNIEAQNTEAINADPVAVLVISFMRNRSTWSGRVSELLASLAAVAPEQGIKTHSKIFPTQPNSLSRRLKAIQSNLQAAGISFTFHSKTIGTIINIQNANPLSLPPYHHVASRLNTFPHGDTIAVDTDNGSMKSSPSCTESLCDKPDDGNGDNEDKNGGKQG